jgi:hypothetical protein
MRVRRWINKIMYQTRKHTEAGAEIDREEIVVDKRDVVL